MISLLIFNFFWNFASIKDIIKTSYLTLIFDNSLLIKRHRRILKSVSPNLHTSLEKNVFKLSIKLITLRLDFSNYIYKMSSQNKKFFFQKKILLCFLLVIFSPRHSKNLRKALNVGYLVSGAWLEELVQLQLF